MTLQTSNEALLLFVRALLSFVFLMLPAVAACLVAVRRNVRNVISLGCIGLAATAVTGYVAFWSWFLSWRLVRPIGFGAEAVAVTYIILICWRLRRDERAALMPLVAPALLVLTSALTVIGATFLYGGEDVVFITAGSRFSHPLPGDNALPYTMAYSMMKYYRVPIPIQLDWLASDRPPLQTAIVLAQYFSLIWPIAMGYQVLCMLLQSLWIFGLWLLLYALRVRRFTIGLILAACLFSDFVFVNTAFVWPKLLAAAYLLGFMALVAGRCLEDRLSRTVMVITAGSLVAWSMLSHGGTVFAFGGLAVFGLVYRRQFTRKDLALLLTTIVLLYIPWMLYQKFVDPPGTRLIKMHLAGVDPIDKRGALETIVDSYRHLTISQIVEYKERNLARVFTTFHFWPVFWQLVDHLGTGNGERSQDLPAIARNMNSAHFFYFPSTVGLYLPGLLFLFLGVLPRFRSSEWKAAVLLLAFTVGTNIFWSLLMFSPDTTAVHAGSYASVLTFFSACLLGWRMVSRWIALALTLLQSSLFVYTNGFVLVAKTPLHGSVLGLSLAAAAVTIYLITRVETAPINHLPINQVVETPVWHPALRGQD